MTKAEEMFCRNYIANGYNATQAYLAAHPNIEYNTANARAYKVLRKPEIKQFIAELEREHLEDLHINAERVLEKLAEIGFSEKGDEYYQATSKLKALDLIQKQLGLQQQKIDVDTEMKIDVKINED